MFDTNSLSKALNVAVENFSKWQDVMEILCQTTGASKAIIALRDGPTAHLIIPERVGRMFGSPLLHNFSKNEVEAYLGHFVDYDPWTSIEAKFHPSVPYALSDHISLADVKCSEFWQWLKPQEINDTFVCELDAEDGTWVSLNLYYDQTKQLLKSDISDYMNRNFAKIRSAWAISQKLERLKLGVEISANFLEAIDTPCMVLSPGLKILAMNQLASSEMYKYLGLHKVLIQGDDLSVQLESLGLKKHQLTQPGKLTFSFLGKIASSQLVIRQICGQQDTVGRNHNVLFVTANQMPIDALSDLPPIWDNPRLTPREREAVKAMAQNIRMADHAAEIGVTLATARTYARDARLKLDGISARDIYAAHRVFLAKKDINPPNT